MTGYESKRAMARDKLLELAQEGMSMHSHDAPEYIVCEALIEALAQPAQEPFGYLSIGGNPIFQKEKPEIGRWETLYTAPPQRPWVEPTVGEWWNWWRVSEVADATQVEIDFGDFILIAQAVAAKLKESNA